MVFTALALTSINLSSVELALSSFSWLAAYMAR